MDAKTEPGRRALALADAHLADFAARAAEHDRQGTFVAQNFADLQASGLLAAVVPEELGGLGLTSVHDWIALLARLATADASTPLALNMHLASCRGLANAWRDAVRGGKDGPAEAIAGRLRPIAAGEVVFCATATERGTDFLRPQTTATRVDDGWRLDGQKIFVTLSPAANMCVLNLRLASDEGNRMAFVTLPVDTPGFELQDDWDALGMRGSGSQSLVLNDCRVPAGSVQIAGPWGEWTPTLLMRRTLNNLTLLAVFLGIADAAKAIAIDAATSQTKVKLDGASALASGVQTRVGELQIALHAAMGALTWAANRLDAFLATPAGAVPALEDAHLRMAEYQQAKWIVHENTIAAVSYAMDIVGGGAYLSGHPLARLYRDVRAGPFMQPGGPLDGREYIGQVALGRPPLG